jgi:predicted RNA-binding protein YlxR (DUF448 family)
VRLVSDGAGDVAVDLAGGAFGRGAHVHARPECIEKSTRGGLSRALRTPIDTTAERIRESLRLACDRRMTGLLLAAARLRQVAVGAEAARGALSGGAPLIIVAVDAGTVAETKEVVGAAALGRAIAWKTKDELGALLGSSGAVAICSISHAGIAGQLAATRRLEGEACSSRCPEVR